jgi:hypothetical protein
VPTPLKIQAGVPKPPVDRRPKRSHRKWPVSEMQPGDFLFDPGRPAKGVSAYISRITKGLPGKYETASVWAWQDQRNEQWHLCAPSAVGAVEGVGVWRTE